MTDRQHPPVETTGGWQPRTSAGERVLVALAAVALLGGVVIVGGNILKGDDAVSLASGSPQPSARPSPTPFATPAPLELTLIEMSPAPSEVPSPQPFYGWIRASVDLPILDDVTAGAGVVGTLPAGAAAYGSDEGPLPRDPGWLHIEAPEPAGWVMTRARGEDLVERYLPASFPISGAVSDLAAGPGGFVAIGYAAGESNSCCPSAVYFSPDGASWHAASEPPLAGGYPVGVAWGPAGWILAATDDGRAGTRLWGSADGDQWRSLGVLLTGSPATVDASGRGYLLQTWGQGFGGGQSAWFSADGIRWTESRPGLGGDYQVTATEAGYYAAESAGSFPPTHQLKAAFSADGMTWSHDEPYLLVAEVGALLGIEPGPDGRGGRAIRGSAAGRVGWSPVKDGDLPFVGAVVTSVVSDGQRATAFGWDATTEAPLTWTSDGGPWQRHRLPSGFGGLPGLAAAGDRGVVVVGNRWNVRGPNPVFWHRDAAGSWGPERSPVVGLAPDPAADDCGAPPADAVELVNLDRVLAVACRGDAPLTMRLWSGRCDGCQGEPSGTYDEEWLAYPTRNALWLSPIVWQDGGWITAALAPSLGSAPDSSWLDTWLEVTGHFNDPAATGCRWAPPRDQLSSYSGARPIVDACRQQFVVSSVRVVDGP